MYVRGKCDPVVKANSTHAGGPGSILTAGKRNDSKFLLPDSTDIRMGLYTEGSCTIAPYGQIKYSLISVNMLALWMCKANCINVNMISIYPPVLL